MVKKFEGPIERAAFSDQDFRLFLDAIPTPLTWASLPDQKIRFFNQRFKKTFGYDDGAFETIGDWVENVYVRPEDRLKSCMHWERVRHAEPSAIQEVDAMELLVLCADGTLKTVQHRGVLLNDIGIAIATFEDISARKSAEDTLRSIAYLDALTTLPNRRALQHRWDQEQPALEESGGIAALLLIDLDGFKAVNDGLGHEAGDEVLVAVAKRLRACVRQNDLVCRLGGDEFVAFVPTVVDIALVPQLCQRIGEALAQPIRIGQEKVTIGGTVGASLFPQDGRDLKELLSCADQALYRVKTVKKGGWAWFRDPADT